MRSERLSPRYRPKPAKWPEKRLGAILSDIRHLTEETRCN